MGDYAHTEVLVSTDWVSDHLGDKGLRLLEVDVDTGAYDEGHIEGAVGINWTSQLCDPVCRDVLSRSDFEKLCRESGITNESTVIFYGDNNNWFACYALWQFRYYGHPENRLKIMNGGRIKWISEGRSLTTEPLDIKTSSYTAKPPDSSIRATKEDVFAHLDSGQPNLIDVRSPAEFSGEVIAPPGMNETAQRGGHIPGASNVPWARAVEEDGTFKPYDDLKSLYEAQDVSLDKPAIAYCRIGERSSHTWFALKYLLGIEDVKNYDGSWTEWGNLIGAPVQKA